MSDKPICFVISPIGKEGSDIRSRADKVLKHIITPIAAECGFEAIRADKISTPGMITKQVINLIIEAPMVVADLTGDNANVYYELAVRHAAHKPYVQIIQKGESVRFDIVGFRIIEIDHTDLDNVEWAKGELKKQIEAAQQGKSVESPISMSIDFDRLRRSDDPEKRELASVIEEMSEIKGMLAQLSTTIAMASTGLYGVSPFYGSESEINRVLRTTTHQRARDIMKSRLRAESERLGKESKTENDPAAAPDTPPHKP